MKLGQYFIVVAALLMTFTASASAPFVVKEWDLIFPNEEAYQVYRRTPKVHTRHKGMELVVGTTRPNVKDIWNRLERMRLTYCISNQFRTKKRDVIEAMKIATQDWMDAANVRFTYLPAEDAKCDSKNNKVVFDIKPVNYGMFLAAAFFPSSKKNERNIQIDASSFKYSFVAFTGFLRHELGHVLGFRHEHIVPQSFNYCSREDYNYVPVTKYDQVSVMHYPQCGGKNQIQNMILSDLDIEGARKVYP